MKVRKTVIGNLTKCYSLAPLVYRGEKYFLVAAEKQDRCLLFDLEGKLVDTIWDKPGGTMSMVQVPGSDGQFLATQKFYSPNDSKEAEIVIVTPKPGKGWEVKTLVKLPLVHRFDIIQCGDICYLIACTLKLWYEDVDDWSIPGKVYGAELPKNLSYFDEGHPLELTIIKENIRKNHGYCKIKEQDREFALIGSEEGVFSLHPPEQKGGSWEVKRLIDTPASDALLLDLDQDGKRELVVLSPFHGENIQIYKEVDDGFLLVYEYPKPAEFLHAIWGGDLCGQQTAIIGHRQGERNLLAFTYDEELKNYRAEVIDHGRGPANVLCFKKDQKDIVIAANRETDEIAMYEIEK